MLRYRIIYDIYCKREDLEKDVNKYINIPEKTGLNQLISMLSTFLLKRELDLLIPYCENDELKNIAVMAIENKIMEKLIYRKGDEDKFVCSDELFNCVKKLLSYFAFNRSIYNLKNEDDTYFELYDEEFYYEVIAAAYRMSQSVVLETKYNEADYLFIINSIEKINTLSLNLQMEILQKVLLVLTDDKSRFDALYTACSDFVKDDVRIQMLKYVSIEASGDFVEIEDVLKCANEGGDYFAVHLCLSKFSKEKAQDFLKKNDYLFSKDSYFFVRKLFAFRCR